MAATRARRTLAIALVLALALGLRLWRLDAFSFWLDESFSLRDAVGLAPFNRIRPAYYFFLKVWLLFGSSDSWVRLPSVLFGTGSVYVLYRLGRQLAGTGAALLAALLLALSPLAIDQSQQARMYELGSLLGLLGCLALSRAIDAPGSLAVPLWAAARLAMISTAPFNAALLVADAALVLRLVAPARRHRFLAWTTLLLLWLPCLIATVVDPASPLGVAWLVIVPRPSLLAVIFRLGSFVTGQPAGAWSVVPCYEGELASVAYLTFVVLLVALAALAVARGDARLRRVAAWALVPPSLLLLASFGPASLWLSRYLYFAAPYLLLLIAAGFLGLAETQRALAALVAAAYALALVPALRQHYANPGREDWRGVAREIMAREQAGDHVVVLDPAWLYAFHRYYRGSNPVASGVRVAPLLHAQGRSWIVYLRWATPGSPELERRALDVSGRLIGYRSFEQIDLFLVDPDRATRASGAI